MTIDADDIPVIVDLFADSGWEDLEVTSGDIRLVLSKRVGAVVQGRAVAPPAPAAPTPASGAAGGRSVPSAPQAGRATKIPPPPAPPAGEEPPEGVLAVRSPTLGTFFVAPKPGAPPFVQPGDRVGADDTLGIVEVMKLMNPVKAGTAGEVMKVCAANNELVEYDRVLFWIRPEPQ
ncbi:MAG TPA: biotin/lipoyl-containing protein [Acidimicrobiia bacterium]